jgi:hypothetical protein
MSGAPARVSWQVCFSWSVALLACPGDRAGVELLFASDRESANLDAVQATEAVIEKKIVARNNFMTAMMPEHFLFVI